jgi:ankyrin repeat protein
LTPGLLKVSTHQDERIGKSIRAELRGGKKNPMNFHKISSVLIVAMLGCCAFIQGAEIHDAAELGDLGKVKACLATDPKQINTADAKGRTVLACAILSGKKEVVDFLLEKGATEDIFAAAITGHTDKITALLKQDPKLVNIRDSGGKTALHLAALAGQKQVVELLLTGKADINMLDADGFTALHWAAMFDKSDVAGVLLTNKADFNLKVAKFGWTPLRLAVIHNRLATAEILLKAGSDPNVKDEDNIPLLHQAIISGHKGMIELLVANKADLNAKDSQGDSPMDEAVETGQKEIIDLMRQLGAKGK